MTVTEEYTANAIRCLERSQEARDPQRANLNVAQAAVWASLAQGAQLGRIANALEFLADASDGIPEAACTCGVPGGYAHSDDCPCYTPDVPQ